MVRARIIMDEKKWWLYLSIVEKKSSVVGSIDILVSHRHYGVGAFVQSLSEVISRRVPNNVSRITEPERDQGHQRSFIPAEGLLIDFDGSSAAALHLANREGKSGHADYYCCGGHTRVRGSCQVAMTRHCAKRSKKFGRRLSSPCLSSK